MELQPSDYYIYCQNRVLLTFPQDSRRVAVQVSARFPNCVCVRERRDTQRTLLSWAAGVTCPNCLSNGGTESKLKPYLTLNLLIVLTFAHMLAAWHDGLFALRHADGAAS